MTTDPWKRHKSPAYPAPPNPRGRLAPDLGVMDPMGRLVFEKRIAGSIALLDLPNCEVSGQYTLGLYLDGIKAETISFQVIR